MPSLAELLTKEANFIREKIDAKQDPSPAQLGDFLRSLTQKSGPLVRDAAPKVATTLREGIENMRKLVYAFYNPNFSFRDLTNKHPALAGEITDCLSGDVNKDFSRLWSAVEEFAPIPDKLPYGMPKVPETASA